MRANQQPAASLTALFTAHRSPTLSGPSHPLEHASIRTEIMSITDRINLQPLQGFCDHGNHRKQFVVGRRCVFMLLPLGDKNTAVFTPCTDDGFTSPFSSLEHAQACLYPFMSSPSPFLPLIPLHYYQLNLKMNAQAVLVFHRGHLDAPRSLNSSHYLLLTECHSGC